MPVLSNRLHALHAGLKNPDIVQNLRFLTEQFPGQVVFSTSFGLEDQAVTHLIFSGRLNIRVFTLDTGRLFPETYATWTRTLERYRQPIESFSPDAGLLEAFVSKNGPDSFYNTVENRRACCHIRKVEPLGRALQGTAVWITGIRAEQSPNRQHMTDFEWDDNFQCFKYHPLFDWSFEQTRAFALENDIPYNPLHDQGFVSIGCAPCTRAIQPGEDFRAGRWWWEHTGKKECGLHIHR